MKPLDPLQIALRGLNLIEASAGTGKTYTITTLYLRLLLERHLEVDRILVVTFTQAATEELRDRIRRRVAQALAWLQGDIAARRAEDPTLADLLLALPDREAARVLLTDALTRMDEAAIHTIHGFCQRILQENAFESGAAFDVKFITDEARLRTSAIEDFWRIQVAQAAPERVRWVRDRWKTPLELLGALQPTLALDDLRVIPDVDEAGIDQERQELEAVFSRLREMWHQRGGEVEALLKTSSALNRRSYNKNVVAKAIAAGAALAAEAAPPSILPDAFERLTPAVLAEKGTKAGETTPAHPFFDLCWDFAERRGRLDSAAKAQFLISARSFVRETLEKRKRDEGLLYFDDLLRRLDQALAGEGADALCATVRQRHPVALIDEFQDTDPQQYRIFRRVYAAEPECGLFLIGDPKQAIYAFRGADIFTYMQAREETAGESAASAGGDGEDPQRGGGQYTLGTNWRSGSRLITAINTLFAGARAPFIYEPHICFERVAPGPTADDEPLLVDGAEAVPLQFWMLEIDEQNESRQPPGFISKHAALEAAARACAEQIAGLLNRAGAGSAKLGKRVLLPRDIALLVRTHREGDLVQDALRACGVSSVTLSQESVFASEDAEELATLLEALAELHHEGRVRAALATSLLGRSASELEQLALDDSAWEAVLARFQSYRVRWQERGFMVALQELIAGEEVTCRLLQRPDGERRLTNLMQLAELLQVASSEHPGIEGLLRWFADQRAGDERDETRQLRLESDEGLVKVVTMHKSKGLEYPLVFIPFPWSYFEPRQSRQRWKRPLPFFHDPGDKAACLDLGSADEDHHRELERIERLAERLRLFYVSVTRAAKLCVLCWGRVKDAQGSAMAYLLHQDLESEIPASRLQGLSEAAMRADLDALAKRAPDCIQVQDLPTATGERWRGPDVDRQGLSAATFGAVIDGDWRVTSYSGLVRGDETEHPDYDAVAMPEAREEDEPEARKDRVFDLPAGTHAGQFLHDLFEILDFPKAAGEALDETVQKLLQRYGQLRAGRANDAESAIDWTPVVAELVTNVLDTDLDAAGAVRLRNIAMSDRLMELEFHFPVADLDPAGLRAVLSSFADVAATGEGLSFEPVRGLMRGFIDLVFRHDGRFYILDYKSNLLGDRLSAYEREGLRQAIRQHRYDLQYLIYTVALHRFLGRRVPLYDYERDFGGVYYLFLRGMRPEHGPRYGVWCDRPPLGLIERLDGLFGGGEGAA